MAFCARWTAGFLSCLALSGCASSDLMVKRLAESEAKIEHLIQTDKKNEQRLNELTGQIQAIDDRSRDSALQLKQMQASLRELYNRQDELLSRGAQAVTPKIAVVNPEPATKGKEGGPPAEYVKAFGLYSANNFAAAIEAFEAFLSQAPQSDYAANATYWIGECHYSLSDLSKALLAFQKVQDSYPKSTKVPDAMLKRGYTLTAMKERDKATRIFEELIRSYPSSPAAARARERLTAN
jgi:tol-pal system protein YbgF